MIHFVPSSAFSPRGLSKLANQSDKTNQRDEVLKRMLKMKPKPHRSSHKDDSPSKQPKVIKGAKKSK
jgi:hypothetical protein